MEKPKLYLSGPITGHIDEMTPIFHHIKERMSSLFDVFSPVDEIDPNTSWEDSMEICRDRLRNGGPWSLMLVIDKGSWTEESRGVRTEIDIARVLGIPVFYYHADREL